MELEIYRKPNPLKVFDRISKLKKLLKPIKVMNNEKFVDNLLLKSNEIFNIISEGFSIEDDNHINITCNLKCNIPISFYVHIGSHGANCSIIGERPNGTSIDNGFGNVKENLIEALESMNLPDKIKFTDINLTQIIGNSSSIFNYKLLEDYKPKSN